MSRLTSNGVLTSTLYVVTSLLDAMDGADQPQAYKDGYRKALNDFSKTLGQVLDLKS